MPNPINTTHRQLKRWLGSRQHGTSIDNAGHRVLCGLWACANNKNPSSILVNGLAEDVAALERAVRGSQ